jgi:hypothetical protein
MAVVSFSLLEYPVEKPLKHLHSKSSSGNAGALDFEAASAAHALWVCRLVGGTPTKQ